MSYTDVAAMARDGDLRDRLAACAATEGMVDPHPTAWADKNQWTLAASPGWASAYAYAVNTEVERPGLDTSVITDGQILSAVQFLIEHEG